MNTEEFDEEQFANVTKEQAIEQALMFRDIIAEQMAELRLKNSVIEKLITQIDMMHGHLAMMEEEIDELVEDSETLHNREEILKKFLEKHDFGIQDIDEFITSLKIDEHTTKRRNNGSEKSN